MLMDALYLFKIANVAGPAQARAQQMASSFAAKVTAVIIYLHSCSARVLTRFCVSYRRKKQRQHPQQH
jgi:hypothetical protein